MARSFFPGERANTRPIHRSSPLHPAQRSALGSEALRDPGSPCIPPKGNRQHPPRPTPASPHTPRHASNHPPGAAFEWAELPSEQSRSDSLRQKPRAFLESVAQKNRPSFPTGASAGRGGSAQRSSRERQSLRRCAAMFLYPVSTGSLQQPGKGLARGRAISLGGFPWAQHFGR